MPTAQQEAERLRKLGVKEIEVIEHPPEPNPGRPARQGVIVVNNLTRDADLQTSRQPDIWYELPTDMAVGIQNEQNGRWDAEMRLLDRLSAPDRERHAQERAADQALWAEVYHQLPAELRNELETARERLETAQQAESEYGLHMDAHEQRKPMGGFEQQRAWRRQMDAHKDEYATHVATVAQAYNVYEQVAERAHRAMFDLVVDSRADAQIAQQAAEEEARILEQLARNKREAAATRRAATGRLLDHINQQSPTVLFEEETQ